MMQMTKSEVTVMKQELQQRYAYHRWSSREVFAHLKTLPEQALHQELQSVFPTLFTVCLHLYRVEDLWLGVLQGSTSEQLQTRMGRAREFVETIRPAELFAAFDELFGEYDAFLNELHDVHATIHIVHPIFGGIDASYFDLIGHVVNHGTYHRGNITAMLHQLGYRGTPTDYAQYLYVRKEQS
jgi:uncharacterized damage-inducible protein DinB